METFLKYFPATVFVALVLFATKEAIEFVKRRKADKRKIEALHVLLAAECERNHWTIKSLRMAARDIVDFTKLDDGTMVGVRVNKNGWMNFKLEMPNLGHWGSRSVTPVQKTILEKHLVDAAMLDKRLFDVMREAYNAALEMDHVRTGLYECVSRKSEGEEDHLDGFDVYANSELDDVYDRMNALYRMCTGSKLEKHRVI